MSTCGDGEMGNALCHTRTHTHTHTHTHKRSERQTERHTHPVAICRNELAGLRAGSRHMAAQTDLTRPRPSRQTNNCEMHFDMSTARRKKKKTLEKQPTTGQTKGSFLALHCHKSKWNMYKCLTTHPNTCTLSENITNLIQIKPKQIQFYKHLNYNFLVMNLSILHHT